MSDLRELYQEVVLDHSRRPRNTGALAGTTHRAKGYNPLCGDKFTVYLQIEDGIVKDASFDGSGCAISTASASLMTEAVKGKRIEEAEALFRRMHAFLTGSRSGSGNSANGNGNGDGDVADPAGLGKLAVFSGVRQFPVRVKCATLPWHTLRAALDQKDELVSTE